ncbi:hypothetical protein [Mycobacterium leprae]|uniref:hypothetical protein n=1 Tax=Mycobacterium leprae TaxID=1769 RepID=UPI0039BEE4A8
MVNASFVIVQFLAEAWSWQISSINVSNTIILTICPAAAPFRRSSSGVDIYRHSRYMSVFASCWDVGTGFGLYIFLPRRRPSVGTTEH